MNTLHELTPSNDLSETANHLRLLLIEESVPDAERIIYAVRQGNIQPIWERVTTADGLKALLSGHTWDAVLSDNRQSTWGAISALEMTRTHDPDMPFIVVSKFLGEDDAIAIMREGANDYIFKHNLARLGLAVLREVREAEHRRTKRLDERHTAHLAAIVESSEDAIMTLNTLTGIITSWNRSAQQLYGWSPSEIIGKNISIIVPPEKEDESLDLIHRLHLGERIEHIETVRLHRDGHRIDVSLRYSFLRDQDGNIVGVSKITWDIRERLLEVANFRLASDLLRAITETVTDSVFVKDLKGRYLMCNPAAAEFMRHPIQEILGRTDAEFFDPVSAQLLHERDQLVITSGQSQTQEEELSVAGVTRTFLTAKTPYRDAQGSTIGLIGISRDITERTQAEETIRASEDRFRAFMEHNPAAAFIKDEAGRYIYVNPTWCQQFDSEIVHWQGKTDYDFWPKATADLFRASDLACLDQNQEIQTEEIGRDINNREIVWLVMKFPLMNGDRHHVGGMALDITVRKKTEDALRLRDRAIGAATQGLMITDPNLPDNPIVFISPGCERMTGYNIDEMLGRNCRFLQGKDTDPVVVKRLKEAIHAGEACNVELLNYRKDGTPFWNELSISPVHDSDGKLTNFVGVQSDITSRRKLEEQFRQAQKMEAVGQLAGGIAHDFNNLLTIINGYSDLLLDSLPEDDPSRSMVEEIQKAGERSAGLTRQLLAFSRQQILTPRILDLNEIVANTEKMLRRLIGEDIRLLTTLEQKLWAVQADPGQIEQVLVNLAVNARDAMPRGGRLTIETQNVELDASYVETHSDAQVGSYVLLSMADSGTGMTAEVQARIFEPFFTTKEPGKGTGLGLATVYGIIKQSEGHVAVYSELGNGTTIKVYLPRALMTARPSEIRVGTRVPPRGSETILLAEDEVAVRAMTRHILTGYGYTVLEASDGVDAIHVAESHRGPIHLLITDVVMPRVGGRMVAEHLLLKHPEAKVLFVSGYTDDAIIRHGVLKEGVNFLQKPYSPAALAAKIRETLDSTNHSTFQRVPNSYE